MLENHCAVSYTHLFSVFGYFYVVNRGKGNFVSRFIPRLKDREHH